MPETDPDARTPATVADIAAVLHADHGEPLCPAIRAAMARRPSITLEKTPMHRGSQLFVLKSPEATADPWLHIRVGRSGGIMVAQLVYVEPPDEHSTRSKTHSLTLQRGEGGARMAEWVARFF